jgi:pimeloyl-ACP methyl ester carboxylesterase
MIDSGSKKPTRHFWKTGGGKIHYLRWKETGPNVHFLHANGFCAGTYSPFLMRLADQFSVLASDIRYHGDSVFTPSSAFEPLGHFLP